MRRERAPLARHHFTLFDQVTQLVNASEADADVGFMALLLALCSLPRIYPKQRLQYVRRNGPYALVMIAGGLKNFPTATSHVCSWRGCAPKRYARKAASLSWVYRSPRSCGTRTR